MAERSKAFVLKTKMGNHRGFETHSHLRREEKGGTDKEGGKNRGKGC